MLSPRNYRHGLAPPAQERFEHRFYTVVAYALNLCLAGLLLVTYIVA